MSLAYSKIGLVSEPETQLKLLVTLQPRPATSDSGSSNLFSSYSSLRRARLVRRSALWATIAGLCLLSPACKFQLISCSLATLVPLTTSICRYISKLGAVPVRRQVAKQLGRVFGACGLIL